MKYLATLTFTTKELTAVEKMAKDRQMTLDAFLVEVLSIGLAELRHAQHVEHRDPMESRRGAKSFVLKRPGQGRKKGM